MGYQTVANDQVVDADYFNLLMRQGNIEVSTTAQRDAIVAKYRGMTVSVTGNQMSYVWTGGAWQPWDSSWRGYGATWNNINFGNNGGSQTFYRWANGLVKVKVYGLIGSSANISGAVTVSVPEPVAYNYNTPTSFILDGAVAVRDPANGKIFRGSVQVNGENTASVGLFVEQVTDAFSWLTPLVNGQPIPQVQSEQFWANFTYESANSPFNW